MARPLSSPCTDCGMPTTPCTGEKGCRHAGRWEHYMVREKVWAAAGLMNGFLCVGCLERRIGRLLVPSDFTKAPINGPNPWDTPRLAARKGHAGRTDSATASAQRRRRR